MNYHQLDVGTVCTVECIGTQNGIRLSMHMVTFLILTLSNGLIQS
jgi:hypothetical protein